MRPKRTVTAPPRTPIGIAPWAYQAMASPEGESGSARGAAAAEKAFG